MIIRCPKCRTAYSVQNDQVYESGRHVRCSQCQHVWHQMPVFEAFNAAKPNKVAPIAPENLSTGGESKLDMVKRLSNQNKKLKVAVLSGVLSLSLILSVMLLAQSFFEANHFLSSFIDTDSG